MSKVLNCNVTVEGHLYYAGETPSREHQELISNPKVWAGEDDPDDGYEEMRVPELEQLIRDRGLDIVSGSKKADLIAQLREADADLV